MRWPTRSPAQAMKPEIRIRKTRNSSPKLMEVIPSAPSTDSPANPLPIIRMCENTILSHLSQNAPVQVDRGGNPGNIWEGCRHHGEQYAAFGEQKTHLKADPIGEDDQDGEAE